MFPSSSLQNRIFIQVNDISCQYKFNIRKTLVVVVVALLANNKHKYWTFVVKKFFVRFVCIETHFCSRNHKIIHFSYQQLKIAKCNNISQKVKSLPVLNNQGSISPTFYEQLLCAQFPKAQKRLSS